MEKKEDLDVFLPVGGLLLRMTILLLKSLHPVRDLGKLAHAGLADRRRAVRAEQGQEPLGPRRPVLRAHLVQRIECLSGVVSRRADHGVPVRAT